MSKKPHIVIFNPDQWRRDVLGHMGNPAAVTPNLDKMTATDGVSFRQAFCQNTVCTPSRCCFMTGWYTHVRGHRTMCHMLRENADEPNLLNILRKNDYFVWWGGKNDLLPGQESWANSCDLMYEPAEPVEPMWTLDHRKKMRGEIGSDTYYSFQVGRIPIEAGQDHYHDNDWANVLGAVDFIKNAPADKPRCIYLPLTYPHPPYAVEEPWYSMIDRDKIPPRTPAPSDWSTKPSILKGLWKNFNMDGWSEDRWTDLRATYYGMCARVDHQFGLLMSALKEAGIYDDTAVFCFADHGDFTGDYGLVEKTQNTYEDCLSRVPFVVKPPKSTPVKPHVSDALVELTDFSATVYDLLGIDPGYTSFGKSLLPVLAGESDEHRDAVFCEGGRLHGETHCMELEPDIHNDPTKEYWPRLVLQAGEGPEHSKAVMCRTKDFKYVRRIYESDELYDLRSDPQETTNRIDDPVLAGELAGLKDRMLTFFIETGDVVPHDTDERSFV